VALTWDEEEFYLVGRSEFFSTRFQEELRTLFSKLGGSSEAVHPGDPMTGETGTEVDHG
jgi:hypothetical protein